MHAPGSGLDGIDLWVNCKLIRGAGKQIYSAYELRADTPKDFRNFMNNSPSPIAMGRVEIGRASRKARAVRALAYGWVQRPQAHCHVVVTCQKHLTVWQLAINTFDGVLHRERAFILVSGAEHVADLDVDLLS
jgi:hypothetical protein